MSVDAHRRAEMLMQEAERKAARGLAKESRSLYREAATEEARALTHVPTTRRRTRGILAVSAVALFCKAHAFDEAITHAREYLADHALPAFARDQLRELLLDSERARQAHAPQPFDS